MCCYGKNELELELDVSFWCVLFSMNKALLGKIEAMMAAGWMMREIAQLAIKTRLSNIIVKVIVKEQSRLLIAISRISLTLVLLFKSLIQFLV